LTISIDEILTEQQAIADLGETRSLTDEEIQKFEELESQLKAAQKTDEIRSRQRAYMTPVQAAVNVATTKQDDTLDRAFNHYLRTGKENADMVELRAQAEGTGSEGGYLVPDGFRTKLIERMKAFGGIANVAETITTATGNPLPFPTVDDVANVGEIVAEGGTFASGADLTFGTESLSAYKYMAGGGSNLPLRVSVELLQDASFDVEGLVSRKLGERIARIQSTHLVTGTGSGQPKGIVHGLTGIEIAANTAVAFDDLITYIHSVDPAYRDNAVWAFNDASLATIKKIKDDDHRPIFRPADADLGTATGGGTLLGFPVVIDQAFPDISLSSNTTNWGAFGNLFEGYVIRRVRDVVLIVNPWTRAANGQVEFTAWARMDATIQNSNAYIALTGQA